MELPQKVNHIKGNAEFNVLGKNSYNFGKTKVLTYINGKKLFILVSQKEWIEQYNLKFHQDLVFI